MKKIFKNYSEMTGFLIKNPNIKVIREITKPNGEVILFYKSGIKTGFSFR